jgi:hypothetical protein
MAIAEYWSDSQTISTTEYSLVNSSTTLASDTTDGIYQLYLDLNAMVAGDQYELKVYEKVRSASTQRVVSTQTFTGLQPTPNVVLPSLILLHGWDFTLKRLAGSDRTIAWSIRRIS